MDQTELREIEARCMQEAMPRCRVHCPLRMDVRAFMERMAEGNLKEAGKLLERHLPLPEIMTRICDRPCEDVCLRRDLGGSLDIGALEAFCTATVGRQVKNFPRAPKSSPVAVLGNGLAGLVAAFELSRKAWPVTIFYEEPTPALLARRFPGLTKEIVERECAALTGAGCIFTEHELESALLEEARTSFAALFVDADAAKRIFTAINRPPDPATCLLTDAVCAGGALEHGPTGAEYASASRQAGEGRRAATTLERLLTGVSLTAGREGELLTESPLYTPLDKVVAVEATPPKNDVYTADEAIREAVRCLRCECMACVRECVYLQKYGGYPRDYARRIYNNAAIVKGEHLANALINGCMLCGQCTELCPERFSMSELCLSARQDMVERGCMPPSAHEFALEDMDDACGEACALFMGDPAEASGKCGHVFFPGCQLAASRGKQVIAAYDFVRESLRPEGDLGLFLHCCGAPAHWAGNEKKFRAVLARIREKWEKLGKPVFITACASCTKVFREAAPDFSLISLWELLDARLDGSSKTPAGLRCGIHDPCAGRHDTAWQKAVRSLAAKCGVDLVEPPRTGSETTCCGYGGLAWSAQPEPTAEATRRRIASLTRPVLASCIMCRDRLVQNGADCLHLLDILPFSQEKAPAEAAKTPPPGFSARRANRAALRREILKHRFETEAAPPPPRRVAISEDLLATLEDKHILQDDIEEAVAAVEANKIRFLERRSGHLLGAWRPRNVTFWVRYSKEKNGYRLHDAWCHRMIAPGAGRPKG